MERSGHEEQSGKQARPHNIVESLRRRLEIHAGRASVSLAPLRKVGQADLAVVLTDSTSALSISRWLSEQPEIVTVRQSGQRLLLRIQDALVAETGAEIERGAIGPFDMHDLLGGQRYLVEFCDPNATKALHIGHLRNIALGHAFASALTAAGAKVETQSQISDAGRQIAEAMAGFLRYGDGAGGQLSGEKGDHLIGRCYARFVEADAAPVGAVARSDLPIARELIERDDLATALFQRWLAGDNDVMTLWRTIRDLVLSGQRATLARLGAHVDRPLLESAYLDKVDAFVGAGMARGLFAYAPNGALVYETGRDEYPTFPLTRADGFPTLNLRALTIWDELCRTMPDVTTFHVCGDEWRSHTIYVDEILRVLHPDRPVQPTYDIVHGMVSGGDGIMKSSAGNAILIDDLLDELAAHDAVRHLVVEGRRNCEADDLAVIIALGYCLDQPLNKPLVTGVDPMLDPHSSTGLTFARAWTKAWTECSDGEPDPRPHATDYRFVAMQAQFLRQLVSHTVRQRDALAMTRFLARLGEWYLSAPATSPSIDRLMRSLLCRGFRALGLTRPQPDGVGRWTNSIDHHTPFLGV